MTSYVAFGPTKYHAFFEGEARSGKRCIGELGIQFRCRLAALFLQK